MRNPLLGFVGDIDEINPMILDGLMNEGFIPVVATLGTDGPGQAYNINADTVAGAIAEALGAEKLVYLTDIEGLRRVVDEPASLIRQTTTRGAGVAHRRRHDRRRDDPEGRELHPRRAPVSAGRTSSTVASRTSSCSRSSPTPASARWSSATRGATP